jgi:hypothetical protein
MVPDILKKEIQVVKPPASPKLASSQIVEIPER